MGGFPTYSQGSANQVREGEGFQPIVQGLLIRYGKGGVQPIVQGLLIRYGEGFQPKIQGLLIRYGDGRGFNLKSRVFYSSTGRGAGVSNFSSWSTNQVRKDSIFFIL